MPRAADVAYDVIRELIDSGEYPAGSWLREEELAARSGVSRTPVRQALRQLEIDHLIELVPNRGALVLGWSRDDLDDIHDLRAILESHAVRRAAEAPSGAVDIARLTALCDEMERLLDEAGEVSNPRIGELSSEFHTALHEASGNRHLVLAMPGLIQIPLAREGYHQRQRAAIVRSLAQHREIVDAIAARDPEWAEAVMRAHIRAGRQSLRTHGRWADGEPDPDPR